MPKFANPRGLHDILPTDWPYYDFVIQHAVEVAQLFGYHRMETPTFGRTSLFTRTTGEGTDIVDKEMYIFEDRDHESMALRPEGTAPVMRAYHEHGMSRLPQPVKIYYIERMFRYDKPQQGRYREHRQFGCEAIGLEDAYVDVEMISLLDTFYRRIGLDDLSLHLNTIGDRQCRPAYLEALVAYLRERGPFLSKQDRDRAERNPLRVLDSKDRESQRVIEAAPHMVDYLCIECRAHWEKLKHGLGVLGIAFETDDRLVRGLDYYTRTVFEFAPRKEGAQAVVGGGGRYDALSEAMGEKHVPGIGFGSGIERLVLNVQDRGVEIPVVPGPTVYVAHIGEGADDSALKATYHLRQHGIAADMAFGGRVLKTQLKNANAAHAQFTAIIGEDEIAENCVTLRSMESETETRVPTDELIDRVRKGPG